MIGGASVRLTHIGGPTRPHGGCRLAHSHRSYFRRTGRTLRVWVGASSAKLTGPAMTIRDVGPIDVVLLTHDHHADNLDESGRGLLADAPNVVTTRSGARRLGGLAYGLAPGESVTLDHAGRTPIEVTATPCRHGPPLSRPVVGDVVGFALTWPGQRRGTAGSPATPCCIARSWTSLPECASASLPLHLGGVRFPITGPLRYTMTARDALRLCARLRPSVAFPVHYEGWSHFAEGRAAIERQLSTAPDDVRDRFQWLPIATPTDVEV